MPKKTAKQKKKDRKQPAAAPKPPSLLLPSPAAVPTASTSDREILGLPRTPKKEVGNVLEECTAVPPAATSSKGKDEASEPIDIQIPPSAAESSSTHSSPPHDAAAVLAALASRSPRHPSPRPTTSPRPPATPQTATSPLDTSPITHVPHIRVDGRAQGSTGPSSHPSSISRSSSPQTAPTLVRSSKGIAFMPSASHFLSAQPTIDTGEEITSSALKPPMSRTASGVARELVQGDMEKAVIKRMSQGSLRGLATSQSVQIPPTQGDQDPVSEAQVDEMVEKGRIEVGVVPDPPKLGLSASGNLGVPTQEELQAGAVDGEDEAEAESGAIAMGIATTPVRSKSGRGVRSVAKSPSTVLQKREPDDEAPYENEVTVNDPGSAPRSKKRSFPRLPSVDLHGSPDSEDERVLNEVSHDGQHLAIASEPMSRSTTPSPDVPVDEKQQPEPQPSDNRDPTAYVPPYKTRKPYKPVLLHEPSGTTEIAISLFAAVTRQHEVPYAASRRLEVRLAWKEPSTWVWVPGRKYIPDWKIDFVARRVEDGIVRKTVKGVLGYTPVFWRLAEWI